MEDLKKTIQAIAADGAEPASVSVALQAKASIGLILDWVGGYLTEHPNNVLELYVYRARPGPTTISARVTSDSMARAMDSLEFRAMVASFGDAGHGGLPGQPRYRTRKFKCRTCGREVNGIPIDGLSPPMCMNKHPPRRMDLE